MCDVATEKKPTVGLWAARSRQRCVGVHQPEAEVDQLGPTTPVVPERAQAEVLSTENLGKHLDANARFDASAVVWCVWRALAFALSCSAVLVLARIYKSVSIMCSAFENAGGRMLCSYQ